MTNVEKLKELGILADIRQRIGNFYDDDATPEKIERADNRINLMSPLELVKAWTAWEIGDGSWALHIIQYYEALQSIQPKADVPMHRLDFDWTANKVAVKKSVTYPPDEFSTSGCISYVTVAEYEFFSDEHNTNVAFLDGENKFGEQIMSALQTYKNMKQNYLWV